MIDNILKVLLFLTPLLYVSTIKLSLINFEIIWFQICVFILFIGSLFDTKKRELPGKTNILILLSICLFNIYNHDFNIFVVNQVLNIFLLIIGLKIIVEYCDDYKSIYKFLIAGIILNCIAYVSQILGFDPIYHDELKSHPGGFLNSMPRLTTFIAITAPLAIYYSWYLYFFLMSFCFIKDPQIWAVCSCVLICFVKMKPKERILFFLILLNIPAWAFALKPDYYFVFLNKIAVRLEVLHASIWYIFYYNFKGCGLGMLPDTFGEITAKKDATILSSFLQFIMQAGIFVIPYLIYTLSQFKKYFNKNSILNLTILSLIFMCVLEYPFEVPRFRPIIMSLIGFYLIELINGEQIYEKYQ